MGLVKAKMQSRSLRLRLLRKPRGQAMMEYAATTSLLLFGAIGVGAVWPFYSGLVGAFDRYLGAIYFTLNMMLP